MSLYEAKPERAAIHNRRALWENSPALRESVRDDLYEWGGAMRGGMPKIGYYSEQPFSITPSKMPPSYDADKVQAITDTFVMWVLIQKEADDPEIRAELGRLQRALKLYFVRQGPAEANAARMKVSKRTFYRILGEAMYRFWVLHY